ncbi:MAG: hypothetical protein SF172_13465 [Burkholderiales bacterium]|nr:hypothetical protein [Burkholderiales bacterium]
MEMVDDIKRLLGLFAAKVQDRETHGWVASMVADERKWVLAHDVFDKIRSRNLVSQDSRLCAQYFFEEICCKSIWNETDTDAPFDSDAPHFIIKSAIGLARVLAISDSEVLLVVVPIHDPHLH